MKIKLKPLFVPAVLAACGLLLASLSQKAPSEAALRVMEYANAHQVQFSDYPESLVELLERNPEAEGFVLDYPFREESPVDLSSFDVSDGVPLFLQWDQRWGYLAYGSDFVGVSGSGAMCLAMAGYYISGGDKRFSPDELVAFAVARGYDSGRDGSSWTLFTEGGPALGLKVTGLSLVEQKIAGYLKNGDPVIASMGQGDFADGQYIVLTGYDNGMVTVNDPGSRANSERLWSFDELDGQVRNLWFIQKEA